VWLHYGTGSGIIFIMKCKTCKKFFKKRTNNKRDKNKFCSSRCALAKVRTREHQIKAGKAGALVNIIKYRGTGTKTYVKENGRHQHRVVMEKHLGRKLLFTDIVHHINENKKDNRLENLQLMTRSEHIKHHIHDKIIQSSKKNNHRG